MEKKIKLKQQIILKKILKMEEKARSHYNRLFISKFINGTNLEWKLLYYIMHT